MALRCRRAGARRVRSDRLVRALSGVPRDRRPAADAADRDRGRVCHVGERQHSSDLTLAIVLFSVARIALLTTVPLAASNTYRQQYQIGRFMHRYYDGKPIAVQDLGYIAYAPRRADRRPQRTREPTRCSTSSSKHQFDKQAMRKLIDRDHVQAIALFPDAYGFGLPTQLDRCRRMEARATEGQPAVLDRHLLHADARAREAARTEAAGLSTRAPARSEDLESPADGRPRIEAPRLYSRITLRHRLLSRDTDSGTSAH